MAFDIAQVYTVNDAVAEALHTARNHVEALQKLQTIVTDYLGTESADKSIKKMVADAERSVSELTFILEIQGIAVP